jgi:hypothetical protein
VKSDKLGIENSSEMDASTYSEQLNYLSAAKNVNRVAHIICFPANY